MNLEITFRLETKNLPKDIDRDDECWTVECREKGKDALLGSASVKKKADCDRGIIYSIQVEEEHRRRGIATRLVKDIRTKWPNVKASDGFTEDGEAFVNSLPPESVCRFP